LKGPGPPPEEKKRPSLMEWGPPAILTIVDKYWLPLKIVLFPDLCVRAKIKMLTYYNICCAFYFHPSLTSEKITNF
ncbi:MAG: hypothetical protein Q8P48_08430, partial [Deltaproteobacteria bacterium]|nr:hypothetical protein [Deltaproteobacteria bacterium]